MLTSEGKNAKMGPNEFVALSILTRFRSHLS